MSNADSTAESRFDAFYVARLPALVHGLFLAFGDLERAEDSAQEAFVRAWQRWAKLEDDDPVAWVRKVAWRLCIDDWRRRRRMSAALAVVNLSQEGRAPGDLDNTRSMLDPLSAEQATVVVLYYVEDLPVDEIADLLEIPSGTVKSRLSRAREILRGALPTVRRFDDD